MCLSDPTRSLHIELIEQLTRTFLLGLLLLLAIHCAGVVAVGLSRSFQKTVVVPFDSAGYPLDQVRSHPGDLGEVGILLPIPIETRRVGG